MEIIKYLMEHFDIEEPNKIMEHAEAMVKKFDRDDIVELANVIITLDNVPKELFNKLYEYM